MTNEPMNPRTSTRWLAVLGTTVALGLAGLSEAALNPGRTEASPLKTENPNGVASSSQESAPAAGGIESVADVAEKAVPSVVNISTTRKVKPFGGPGAPMFPHPFFRHFFDQLPQPPEQLQQGLGSGVLVGKEGVVLTNNHVVEGADEVRVTLHDGRELDAEIVGTDPPSDLAVVKIKNPPEGLSALPLGNSDALRLGEVVVAIGNPFGVGQTVTMGIVSAKGRANVGIVDYEDFIQTDAAINPGNSGGALLNLRGELVGINTAILSRTGGYQGIGFAIPSNMASAIFTSLVEEGRVIRGFLGVAIQDLTPELASAMDLSTQEGVLISEVVEGSPAARAGLQPGDVVVKVDGEAVPTAGRLRNRIAALGAGRSVELTVVRDGVQKKLKAELEEKARESAAPEAAETPKGAPAGVRLQPLTDQIRRQLGLSERIEQGVVVAQVQPGSPAARAGLQPGDVVLSVDRAPVSSPEEFRSRYEKGGGSVLLRVYRGGGAMFLVLEK